MELIKRPMTIIHVETNGLDPEKCDVTRVTVCDVNGGEITGRWVFDGLADTTVGSTRINGLPGSWSARFGLDQGTLRHDVDALLFGGLGTELLLCNNAPWTLEVLGYQDFTPSVLDVSVLDQIAQGARPRARTWHALCTAHGVRSTDPCASYLEILRTLCARNDDLCEVEPRTVHAVQQNTYRARAEDYRAYLARTPDRAHEADGVRTSWPI